MFYEFVRLRPDDTVSGLATEYCYKAADWEKIWKDPKNLGVASSMECWSKLEQMICLDGIKLA